MWKLTRSPLVFWLIKIFVGIVTFLLVDVVFNVAQVLGIVFAFVFFYHFDNIDLNS